MAKKTNTIQIARATLRMEAEALMQLAERIDRSFDVVCQMILKSKGRLVITGIGKSANIAQKLVATFNSTGQPAIFMHAADAIHGDLGNVQKEDMVLCISKSGDSPEIKVLVPLVKSLGNPLIGMAANATSFLGLNSDYLLHTPIDREACPHNLAPTTSTTAQLAMGDALAMALMQSRGFTAQDFARYHPGGALGKKLYLRVGDLVQSGIKPLVKSSAPIKDVIAEISQKRLGAAAVVDKNKLVGVITDGDIRRMLERKNMDINLLKASDIMNKKPKTIDFEELAVQGFQWMEKYSITQLVVTQNGKYAGIVHLHDILKEGIF
jgi:arabinose-5-phosphate isomerase